MYLEGVQACSALRDRGSNRTQPDQNRSFLRLNQRCDRDTITSFHSENLGSLQWESASIVGRGNDQANGQGQLAERLTVIFVLTNKRCIFSPTIERCSGVGAVEVDRVFAVAMIDESDDRFTTTLHHERGARSPTYSYRVSISLLNTVDSISICDGKTFSGDEMFRGLLPCLTGKHGRLSIRSY